MTSLEQSSPLSPTPPPRPTGLQSLAQYIIQNWILFALGAPAVILIFLFSYIPMFGSIIAFENYSSRTGFFSEWVGLRNFALLWDSPVLWRLLRNTAGLNIMFIVAETVAAVVLALLLNEVRWTAFKRFSQSVLFLPYFMGWTIVAMVLFGLTDYDVGTINVLLETLGLEDPDHRQCRFVAIHPHRHPRVEVRRQRLHHLPGGAGRHRPAAARSRRHRWRRPLAAHALSSRCPPWSRSSSCSRCWPSAAFSTATWA